MNTIKNKVLSFLGSIVFSFKISFKASPAIMCLRLITILVSSIVPFVNAEASGKGKQRAEHTEGKLCNRKLFHKNAGKYAEQEEQKQIRHKRVAKRNAHTAEI